MPVVHTSHQPGTPRREVGRYGPAIVAVAILSVVGIAAAYGGTGGPSGSPSSQASPAGSLGDGSFEVADEVEEEVAATPPDPPEESVALLPEVPEEPETTGVPKDRINRTIAKGHAGKDVKRVQERLIELGFDPGEADGIFGEKTRAAVWAYEKLLLDKKPEEAKGQVTPKMWLGMQDKIVVRPERTKTTKTHLEIYLSSQVAVLFVGDKVRLITHISSGSGEDWEAEVTIDAGEEGNERGTETIRKLVNGTSITPGGVFKFYRRYVDEATGGWRESRLGRMYKPVYFNFGIAIHGSRNVPDYPASHGCVRIPMHIAEYFPDLVKNGDRVYVFDGKKSPEYYGAQHPPFDSVTEITSATTTTVEPTSTTGKPTTTNDTTTTSAAPDATGADEPPDPSG